MKNWQFFALLMLITIHILLDTAFILLKMISILIQIIYHIIQIVFIIQTYFIKILPGTAKAVIASSLISLMTSKDVSVDLSKYSPII